MESVAAGLLRLIIQNSKKPVGVLRRRGELQHNNPTSSHQHSLHVGKEEEEEEETLVF